MKVLLAEDEKRMNRALCELLRQEGYEVTPVDNGADALDEIESGLYDLIVHLGQRRAYSSEDYQAGIVYFIGVLIREILVYVFIGAAAAYLTSKAFGRFPVFRKKGGIGPRSGKDSGTT